ncbi:MAG: hypothetical protein GEV07_16630 [Streptosporangiales bacterium]|nr:hypothetical protein [Streptosporangiales bacterium]
MTSRVEDVADELYGLHPSQFTATRDQRAKEAAAAGDKVAAKAIRALRRPSTSAWLCNMLQRHRQAEIAELAELGEALRGAQATLAGEELRELAQRRRRFVDDLRAQARTVAAELEHPASETVLTEVEQTVQTALIEPDAAAALLAGRLTTALQPDASAMFGLPAAAPAAADTGAPPADFQLAKARKEYDRATRFVHDAEQQAATCRREISAAEHRLTEAIARHEELVAALEEAERDRTAAERRVAAAEEAATAADDAVDQARTKAKQAKAHLDTLTQ